MGFASLYPSDECRALSVMPGLVPGIHVLGAAREKDVGRDEPGHDADRSIPSHALRVQTHPVPSYLLTYAEPHVGNRAMCAVSTALSQIYSCLMT